MKKRLFAVLTAVVFAAAVLGACSAAGEKETTAAAAPVTTESVTETVSEPETETSGERAAILLTLEDSVQADTAWDGLHRFAEENGYSSTTASWRGAKTEEKLEEMVKSEAAAGFSVVACYGDAFLNAVLKTAEDYPDTVFLFLGSCEEEIPENVHVLNWKEEQAGFLAGYAAVYEGAANLGFIGRKEEPVSVRYGYGFVQGADAAALEQEREIQIKYAYVDEEMEDGETEKLAQGWFEAGTEVIFAEGSVNGAAAIAAAGKGGKVIGSDYDWSGQSPVVLTSAVKKYSSSVYDLMEQIEAGEREGGEVLVLGAEENGIGLPMETSRFHNFSETEYELVLSGLATGDYAPVSDLGKEGKKLELSDLNLTNTEIKVPESSE